MTFRQAVQATPAIRHAYRPGLKALAETARAKITCNSPRRLTGSMHLDEELRGAEPHSARWDYGVGYRGSKPENAIWIEVHPASSDSVSDMVNKLRWLKNWLQSQAPKLWELTRGDYRWVSTDGRIAISPNSPQAKRLAAAGLRGPMRRLVLK